MRFRPVSCILLAAALASCRPPPPPPVQQAPVVRAFSQYSRGDTLELLRIQLSLDNYPVRYRTSMPPDEMGMVYFLEDGNLHVDVKRLGSTWVLLSTPLLDPSTVPAEDRVEEWDRGADAQKIRGPSDR
ncbi:MAG TPA: hypothetical protein VHY22_00575 [Chthoniobacteraceae bacterium]|jgi:hypothetical protein|nr:hypothetical protein [Chthoniobacteraceae bacterium]